MNLPILLSGMDSKSPMLCLPLDAPYDENGALL